MTAIGIDFGGSRLRVALASEGQLSLLCHRYSAARMPFVAALGDDAAKASRFRVVSLKRMLDFDPDPSAALRASVRPAGPTPLGQAEQILADVREDAAAENDSLHCALAVPPCFSERQRSALRQAAVQAGFLRVRLVDDTLAALLASRPVTEGCRNVLVYSWGASSFSAILYQLRTGGYAPVAQEGDRLLGGDDVDAVLADAVWAALTNGAGRASPDAAQCKRIAEETETAKCALGDGETASIPLARLLGAAAPPSGRPASGERSRTITLRREMLEKALDEMTRRTLQQVQTMLAAAQCPTPDIVLAVGRMANLPAVTYEVEEQLHAPVRAATENAVALGAARHALAISHAEWEKVEQAPAPRPRGTGPPSQSQPEAGDTEPVRWADHFVGLLNTAEEQEQQGRLPQAIDTCETLFTELGRFTANLYCKRAAALEAVGKLDEAVHLLQDAFRREPSSRVLAQSLAQACLRRAAAARQMKKGPEKVVAFLQPGIEALEAFAEGSRMEAAVFGQLLYLRAVCFAEQGHFQDAEADLAACVRLDPSQPAYAKNLEDVRGALKRMPRAAALPPGTKVGRNDRCPFCDSGKKYKNCHGKGK